MINERRGAEFYLELKDYSRCHCENKVPIYLKDPDVNL